MRLIRRVTIFIVLLVVVCLTIGTVFNVVMRYVFSNPILAYEEVVLFLFVWLVSLGLPICYRYGTLMCVEIFDSESMKKILGMISDIALFIFLLLFSYLGTVFAITSQGKVTNILRIPYFFIDIAVVVGCILTTIEILYKYLRSN